MTSPGIDRRSVRSPASADPWHDGDCQGRPPDPRRNPDRGARRGVDRLVNGCWSRMKLPPFIATLGILSVVGGLPFIVGGENAVYGLPSSFRLFGEGQIGPIPLPILYLIVIAVAGHLILTRTKSEVCLRDRVKPGRAAIGIPLNRYLIFVYVIPAGLAGFGGMIAASLVHSGQPNYGVGLELNVIAACVIGGASLFGGVGTIRGTLIGAFSSRWSPTAPCCSTSPSMTAGDHRSDYLARGVVGSGPPPAPVPASEQMERRKADVDDRRGRPAEPGSAHAA